MLNTLVEFRPKKRLFLGFLLITEFFVTLSFYGFWLLCYQGLEKISKYLPLIIASFLIFIFIFSFGAICNMILAIKGLPTFRFFHKYCFLLIRFLFPLAVRFGNLFGIKRRQLERSFIAISNSLFVRSVFMRSDVKVPAKKLLVLAPHCLQLASCPHKITRDPNGCKRCGKCNIGDLMNLAEELGFIFFVATGGTLARQLVEERQPQAILAIACERDLMSGIQDVFPLPIVGILNTQPNGSCFNTNVDMNEVTRVIKQIIKD